MPDPTANYIPSAKDRITLFIAIGSAPSNVVLRHAARLSWLQWVPKDGSVKYRFFSDLRPRVPESQTLNSENSYGDEVWDNLEKEVASTQDITLQPLDSGYGRPDDNSFGKRALFQIRWANYYFDYDYYLRVDDDSFLCLHKLLYEIKSSPREQYMWGRFWCREGRNRADENFLLLSRDVANFVVDDRYMGKIIPFDDKVTFGWNFGYLSWILNLTIFDDQSRLDSQQGYLTEYMHATTVTDYEPLSMFCDKFVHAHHVHAAVMTETFLRTKTKLMYTIPQRTSPRETCPLNQQSFVPSRHSSRFPDIRLSVLSAL